MRLTTFLKLGTGLGLGLLGGAILEAGVGFILREAEDRWHGDDDCAVLALRAERLGDGKKRV